jgi:hypothetical protein
MIVCTNCASTLDDSAASCPYCRAPLGAGGLTRTPGMHDALVRDDTDALLPRTDDLLTRELAEQLEEPLTLAELKPMLVREEAQLPSLDRLETLLTRDVDAQLDGITLSSLLDRGSSDTKILQRGLVFLRKQRYTEALEWWTLHRESLDATQERLFLLLLLMEAFTHELSGNQARAAKVREQIRAQPIVQRLRR